MDNADSTTSAPRSPRNAIAEVAAASGRQPSTSFLAGGLRAIGLGEAMSCVRTSVASLAPGSGLAGVAVPQPFTGSAVHRQGLPNAASPPVMHPAATGDPGQGKALQHRITGQQQVSTAPRSGCDALPSDSTTSIIRYAAPEKAHQASQQQALASAGRPSEEDGLHKAAIMNVGGHVEDEATIAAHMDAAVRELLSPASSHGPRELPCFKLLKQGLAATAAAGGDGHAGGGAGAGPAAASTHMQRTSPAAAAGGGGHGPKQWLQALGASNAEAEGLMQLFPSGCGVVFSTAD
jgi:hypothetical protein